MIRKETIERIRIEVATCPEDALEQEFERFFLNQTEICDFVMDVTSRSRQQVRELALYLSYVTYKALDQDGGLRQAVPEETIVRACRQSQEWIQALSDVDDATVTASGAVTTADIEPYLLGFVVTEVQEAVEDGLALAEEEKGTVFFVLKTVITSMAATLN